jgi:hypothetical protein
LLVGAVADGGVGATAGVGVLAGVLAHAVSMAADRIDAKYRMRGTMACESLSGNACHSKARAL